MTSFVNLVRKELQKFLEEKGTTITVTNYVKTGEDNYGQPIYSTASYTLRAVVEGISMQDARYVEAGFLPEHYVYFYIPYDEVSFTFNQMKDEINYGGVVYIIRQIFVPEIGGTKIYFKILARRKEVIT